jgi:hypothetical protein
MNLNRITNDFIKSVGSWINVKSGMSWSDMLRISVVGKRVLKSNVNSQFGHKRGGG